MFKVRCGDKYLTRNGLSDVGDVFNDCPYVRSLIKRYCGKSYEYEYINGGGLI